MTKVLKFCRQSVTLTRRSHIGCVNFAVDLDYSFGLKLPLLLTTEEALKTIGISKVGHLSRFREVAEISTVTHPSGT